MTTLTVTCPVARRPFGDKLAVGLGTQNGSPAEAWVGAFNPWRVDADGNVWHVMSMEVSYEFIQANAQALGQTPGVRVWQPAPEGNPAPVPTALDHPDQLIAVIGLSGLEALAAIGLQYPPED